MLIRHELRDPRLSAQDKLFLSITDVKVSRDIAVANIGVSWSKMGIQSPGNNETTKAIVLDVLQGAAGFLRSRLAHILSLRSMPALKFHDDDTSEKSARIASLLAAEAAQDEG